MMISHPFPCVLPSCFVLENGYEVRGIMRRSTHKAQ
jgi:hypothetical protein